MTTVEALAEELDMHAADLRYWISEMLALDLHDDDLPGELVGEVRSVFSPEGERAPARRDHELVRAYALFGDGPEGATILQELRMHGHGRVAQALQMERLLTPSAAERYTRAIDAWLMGGAPPADGPVLVPVRRSAP
jgi:hypothetical protein